MNDIYFWEIVVEYLSSPLRRQVNAKIVTGSRHLTDAIFFFLFDKRVRLSTDRRAQEKCFFLKRGKQKNPGEVVKRLWRKKKGGGVYYWSETDAAIWFPRRLPHKHVPLLTKSKLYNKTVVQRWISDSWQILRLKKKTGGYKTPSKKKKLFYDGGEKGLLLLVRSLPCVRIISALRNQKGKKIPSAALSLLFLQPIRVS